ANTLGWQAPTASDACNGATVNIVSTTSTGTSCQKVFTRTWNAVDLCGNTSGNVSQNITVRDVTAPTIGNAGANFSVSGCPNTTDPNQLGWQAPTASDNCNGATVNIVSTTSTGTSCQKVFTRTWNANDLCQNISGTVAQSITVRDVTAPTIGSAGADFSVSGCPNTTDPNQLGWQAPTASDACNGATVNIVSTTSTGTSCQKVFTRTWNANDLCQNISGTVSQSITVRDVTAPTIGSAGADFSVSGCPNTTDANTLGWQAPTASDNCNGATINIVSTARTGSSCSKVWTRTWNASDLCGNTSNNVSQNITVRDVTAPTIGSAGADFSVSGCPNTTDANTLGWQAPTASDACNGATVNIVSTTSTGTSCQKVFTRTWNAVDLCGNTSGNVSQNITVRDVTAPTIGNAGANFSVSGCPNTTDPNQLGWQAPTASDNCNGATVNIVSTTSTGTSCQKVFTRTWNANDLCQNTSGNVSQNITVRDVTAPTIGSAGADFSVSGCPNTTDPNQLGWQAPTASDACNGATVNIVSTTSTGTSCQKVFTRTWNASDLCGNTSGNVSQNITVRDVTAPTIGSAGADFSVSGCPNTTDPNTLGWQ